MRIYDLSLPIRDEMPVWPGDPPVRLESHFSFAEGDDASVSRLALGTHTGTHVDAPAHMRAGDATVDGLPIDAFVGPARVVECEEAGHITANELRALLGDCQCSRLLFKTANSRRGILLTSTFERDFVALTPEAARWLAEREMRLVGIDALSIDPYDAEGEPAHHALLDHGVVIVEGLNLADVPAGDYDLYCLPLSIVGGDGAPARVVVVQRDE